MTNYHSFNAENPAGTTVDFSFQNLFSTIKKGGSYDTRKKKRRFTKPLTYAF
jgi:hypothetical protein